MDENTELVSLQPKKPSQGNVLISYIIDPFLNSAQPVPNSHTSYWESLQMAQTFLDLGYCVDVINWPNDGFWPEKEYSFFIDSRWNLQRLAPLLNKDCVKIMHIDVAHILFKNAAESQRLLALQQRKHVTLGPRRFEWPNLGIEHADCATILGNEFTISTFRYANKPMYPIPISTPVVYPWPEGKDFEACRKRFLWFGSFGLVSKGLDLVLDAFAEMPDYHLTVCGPIRGKKDFVSAFYGPLEGEKDFEDAFSKELYQTPNIHTIGWIDINTPEFIEIANSCIGLIFPSCCEGQAGGVVTCLHAGIIPIISYESGVDVDDFGVILKNCTIEEIKNSIRTVSNLPTPELKRMAKKAWEFARANHTREKFAEEYWKVVEKIIATYRK